MGIVQELEAVGLAEEGSGHTSMVNRKLRWLKLVTISIFLGLLLTASLVVYFQEYLWLPTVWRERLDYTPPSGVKEVILKTTDGERITLWYQDVDPAQKKGAVLVFHGNGDVLPRSPFMRQLFSQLGYTTYEIDYRGTGKSTGWPTEDGLHADAEAAWSYAVQREGGNKALHILGHSFGTGLATYIAQKYDPTTLMLLAPYLSIPDVVSDRWDSFFLRPFARINLPTRDLISHMGSTKIMTIHGLTDQVIPAHHSADLAKLYKGHGSFDSTFVENCDHFDILGYVTKPIEEWMRKTGASRFN